MKPWKIYHPCRKDLRQDFFEQDRVRVKQMAGAILAKMENPQPLLSELFHLMRAK